MKHVVVTGGAKGIGHAVVEDLASKGYKVSATVHDSQKAAAKTHDKYKNVTYRSVDLQDRQSIEGLIRNLSGAPVDVLINNAGVYVGKPFEKMTAAELYQQIDLNFAALARLTQGLLPVLKRSESPMIINVSSQAVNERISGEAMYTAVKAAITNLSYVLRTELNPNGVRVVTFEPFAVNTYGMKEPSGMILPEELASVIRYVIEAPAHLQFDTVGISHLEQPRPDYPDWIEQ